MIRERRRFARTIAKGAVVVHVAGATQNGRIVDVAEGGVLVGTSVTPPERWLGRAADVELRFDTGGGDWLRGSARVVRIAAGGLALTFLEAPSALGRALDELRGASRNRQRSLAVVVIDTDSSRRASMVRAFRSIGCAIVEAGTPLEAIVRLGESSFEPDVIAVADSSPALGAEDLRRFVEEHHPGVSLVRILGGDGPADGSPGWVSASDPRADLPQRVRELLSRVLAG